MEKESVWLVQLPALATITALQRAQTLEEGNWKHPQIMNEPKLV
jgi:hypothetical protein